MLKTEEGKIYFMGNPSVKGHFIALWVGLGLVVGVSSLIIGSNRFYLPEPQRQTVLEAEQQAAEQEKEQKIKVQVDKNQQEIEIFLEEGKFYTKNYEPAQLGTRDKEHPLQKGVKSLNNHLIQSETDPPLGFYGEPVYLPYPKNQAQLRETNLSQDTISGFFAVGTTMTTKTSLGSDTELVFKNEYQPGVTCNLNLTSRLSSCEMVENDE